MLRITVPILLLILTLMPACPVVAQTQEEIISRIIREKLTQTPLENSIHVGSCQISSLKVLPEVYKRRDYRPVWVNAEFVGQLMEAIRQTYEEGLDPNDYHLNQILDLQREVLTGMSPDHLNTASLDILLTDAFIRLATHINCGKEDPVSTHPQWNLERKIDNLDPVEFIESALETNALSETIESWRIHHPVYIRLKAALAEYREIRDNGGWVAVPPGPALKKGMIDQRVADLRKRLSVTEDLPETTEPLLFDEALEQAVIRFEQRHGMHGDGIVGSNVLDALNISAEDRVDQIRVNLERSRWVLRNLEDTFVLVDIAGFRVFFRKSNQIIWSCRAQVGQPYRNTPVLKSKITHVEINPTWVVPPTILEKDVLPEIKKNRGYLKKKNITVLDSNRRPVNPNSIKWSLYPGQRFPYILRQNPGKSNALGRIKIMFPNEYYVYLHDTPHKELFAQEDRTFSSGCIRLEKPFELAGLLLDNPARWDQAGFKRAVDSGVTQTVMLPRPITILLLYWTVEVDEAGIIYFKKDPYDRDRKVLEGLGLDAEITSILKTEPGV